MKKTLLALISLFLLSALLSAGAHAETSAAGRLYWDYYNNRRFQEAGEGFSRLLRQDPSNKDYALGAAYSAVQMNRLDEALRILDSFDAKTPEFKQLRLVILSKKADDAAVGKDWAGASLYLKKMLELDAGDTGTEKRLERALQNAGDADAALLVYLSLYKKEARPEYALAVIDAYEKTGRDKDAFAFAKKALSAPVPEVRKTAENYLVRLNCPLSARTLDDCKALYTEAITPLTPTAGARVTSAPDNAPQCESSPEKAPLDKRLVALKTPAREAVETRPPQPEKQTAQLVSAKGPNNEITPLKKPAEVSHESKKPEPETTPAKTALEATGGAEIQNQTVAKAGAENNVKVFRLPLYKLTPLKLLELKCINAEDGVQIPVPERWDVKRVKLSLGYENSTSLLYDISQLVVKLNGQPVVQRKFNPLTPHGKMEIDIPGEMFKTGYNNLAFMVAQHHTHECERPCAPDLWTNINLNESVIEMDYALKPVPLRLAAISGFLFDPKVLPEGAVNIIMEDDSPETINMGVVVASGIARRFDYKKVVFSVSRDIRPGSDNVLIGKRPFMESFLTEHGIAVSSRPGPFVKLAHLPPPSSAKGDAPDPTHAFIAVSGANNNEVKMAAETLTSMTIAYPGVDEMTAVEFSLPEISLYGGRLVIASDKKYDFKTLNADTHTFNGFNASPLELNFRLPADFLIKQNQYAEIVLNFSYGAGMRPDSVLNIMLNGNGVRAIQLKSGGGDLIEGYKLNIPTYLFKAGSNKLTFSAVMTPVAKECELIQTGNLFLTLFDNSTLYFPPMPHFVQLPAIELFMLNGFPFTRWPDGFESLIYLTNKDRETIASAFNIAGLITQKNGYPVFGMRVTTEEPKSWDGELIVIGDTASTPDKIKQAASLKLTKLSTVPYPLVKSWKGESSFTYSKQISGPGTGSGFLMEFRSPYKQGRTALMLTASTAKDLLGASVAFLEPSVQGASRGDMVMVELTEPDYKVTSLDVAGKYTTGKLGKMSKLDYYLSASPYLYQILIGVMILFVGATTFLFLRRFKRRQRAVANAKTKAETEPKAKNGAKDH